MVCGESQLAHSGKGIHQVARPTCLWEINDEIDILGIHIYDPLPNDPNGKMKCHIPIHNRPRHFHSDIGLIKSRG